MGDGDVLQELVARLRASVEASRKSRHDCSFQWAQACGLCALRDEITRALTDAETDLEKVRLGIFRPSEARS